MKIGKRRKERGMLRDLDDPDFVQKLVDNYTPDPNDMGMVFFRTLQRNLERRIVLLEAKPYSEQRMKWLKEHESDLAETKKLQAQWIRSQARLDYMERTDPNNPIWREIRSK